MKTAAVYCRVSTAGQAQNGPAPAQDDKEDRRKGGTSLDTQAEACQKYADAHGYKVVATFKEVKSGASLDRPMLDQLREMARQGDIEAVIFYALERLSRDETDALILAREWRNKGVDLVCATVPLEDTPQGQFMFTILTAVGKLEGAGILERTMSGKRATVRKGNLLRTAVHLYGYNHIGTGYEIDGEEAFWVRSIFNWYVGSGLSLMAIAHRLTNAGVPTKKGGHWAPTTVLNILTNEAYIGQYWWGKLDKPKDKQARLRPREEWIGPIAVPPLVSAETFEAAGRRVGYNR